MIRFVCAFLALTTIAVGQSPVVQVGTMIVPASPAPAITGLAVPSGTTAQRPTPGSYYPIRWNTTTSMFEAYDGSTWINFQPLDADLTALSGLANTDGNVIVGNGSAWVAESGATARTSLGLTIGTDVQAYDQQLSDVAGLTYSGNALKVLRVNAGETGLEFSTSSAGISDGDTLTTGLTFPLAGLHILDTNASHDLILSPGSDLTADRTLTITTGDANRTLTLSGNSTLPAGTALVDSDIGSTVQAYDADLADLADGSLTGSKVGTGIDADNITGGTITGTGGMVRATSPTLDSPTVDDVTFSSSGGTITSGANSMTITGGDFAADELYIRTNVLEDGPISFDTHIVMRAALSRLDILGQSARMGHVRLGENSANGSNLVTFTAPSSLTADRTVTLPDATGNVVLDSATQTLTNKMINGSSNTITNVSLTTGVTGTLPIANGGTGSTTAANARTALGLAIGTDVQGYDPDLTTYAGITPSANVQTLLGAASYAAFRTSLGVGTGDSPQFTAIELGNSTDTTLARSSAGYATLEGKTVYVDGNLPGETFGSATATTTSATSDDTWFTVTGASVSLPSAGTYLVSADIRAQCTVSAGTGLLNVQLYNSTDSAAVSTSERRMLNTNGNQIAQLGAGMKEYVTVAGAKTIVLQVKRLSSGSATYTSAAIQSDANGYSKLFYHKISD